LTSPTGGATGGALTSPAGGATGGALASSAIALKQIMQIAVSAVSNFNIQYFFAQALIIVPRPKINC
jgi:hypothetical protein